jgi:hypothetical protein
MTMLAMPNVVTSGFSPMPPISAPFARPITRPTPRPAAMPRAAEPLATMAMADRTLTSDTAKPSDRSNPRVRMTRHCASAKTDR